MTISLPQVLQHAPRALTHHGPAITASATIPAPDVRVPGDLDACGTSPVAAVVEQVSRAPR
ncbi:hypothetical protein ACT8ZV_08330 [Nocardioides sp. MAHUQ-72]|uniref:hypothetical protein n=1 Tax=unclassified Nocardioides TaxID=2615069 RepID=UPI00360FB4C9